MLDLNNWVKEVKKVSGKFDKKLSLEGEILGLNEAVAKLWTTTLNHPEDKEEIGERLANLLIGTFILSDRLGIEDLEICLQKRLERLK
jgi:hypothetical protein